MHKVDNHFDVFAIKTVNSDKVITGHFPREISRVTKFLLDRGAVAYAELTLTHYRRSPITQGGLEIPSKITIKFYGTVKNHISWIDTCSLLTPFIVSLKKKLLWVRFLAKTQLPALLPASRIAASSVKKQLKKARKDGNNRVDIHKFFAAKDQVMLNKQLIQREMTIPLKFLIWIRNFFCEICIVSVFNYKAKHI